MACVWLIGMMGSGKSAVGRLLADVLGAPFYDTDEEVERQAGCSISELWRLSGEQAFRDIEADRVAALAGAEPAVIATGGGVVLRPDNVAAMRRSGTVVWLEASPRALAARLRGAADRPLLAADAGPERIETLLAERQSSYLAAAHERVDTSGRSPGDLAESLVGLWNGS